jgi:hypothetical protein
MMGSSSNASSWLNFAQRSRNEGGLGLAPHQAAGLVGNLVNESGQDLNPWGPSGDNGTAWGTAQWRGDRLAGLRQHAAANGMDPRTIEAQQSWMRHEFDTTENKAYQALTSAQSPEDAATAVNRLYERSADTTGGRERSARALMAQFGGDTAPGALTSSYAPTESKASMPALSTDNTLGQGALNASDGDPVASALMGMGAAISGINNPEQAKVLAAQANATKKTGTWSHSIMPNGQIMLSNSNGGFKVIGSPGDYSKDDTYIPVHYKDADGNDVFRAFNKNEGKFVEQGQPAATGPAIGGDPNLTGQDRYSTLSPQDQRTIDGWHEGTGINPSSYVTKNPQIKKLMDAAQAVYPDMDFSKYGERTNFVKGLSNKSPIAFGGQIIGTDHTANLIGQTADQLATLNNSSGSIGGYGQTAANIGKDLVGGNERASNIKNLKQQAETLSAEFQTLMTRGKGGGQAERQEKSDLINQPHAAPEVQAGPLQAMLDALKARHDEYVAAARSSMGDAWLEKHPDIDKNVRATIDATQAKLDKLYNLNKGGTAAKPTTTLDHSAIDAELKRRGL